MVRPLTHLGPPSVSQTSQAAYCRSNPNQRPLLILPSASYPLLCLQEEAIFFCLQHLFLALGPSHHCPTPVCADRGYAYLLPLARSGQVTPHGRAALALLGLPQS